MKRQFKTNRPAGRQNKRELILEAAIEVFARKGSHLSTIADVARKARVALGTVYVYFVSKDDLLQQCMKEMIEKEIATIISTTQSINDPIDRLAAFFAHHVELVKEKPYIARFITVEARQSESFTLRNPGYNPLLHYLNYVKDIAEKAVASGQIKAIDPEAFALILVGSMDIVLWQWLASDSKMDIQQLTQSIRYILHNGVANPQ